MAKGDAIYQGTHHQPINGNAARVMQSGETYQMSAQRQPGESSVPVPLVSAEEFKRLAMQPNFVDLTGVQKGRLTVLGIVAVGSGWLCRCRCGNYVIRTSKSIKRSLVDDAAKRDACTDCRNLITLKREEHWRRTGKDNPDEHYWE
ncbi:TPA: hypothetical protein I9Y37_001897 [Citrobacter freundii]|nr:hypothetical protein [Citrobacter freundii]HAT3963873.1 hypothetical protein [Citrobacter freundii]